MANSSGSFARDIQFARSVCRCWMLDRYQWESVQILLRKIILVLDLLDRCGLEMYYEDGQAVGIRHAGSMIVYKPFPEDEGE